MFVRKPWVTTFGNLDDPTNKKTDVADHPEVINNVGLLVN